MYKSAADQIMEDMANSLGFEKSAYGRMSWEDFKRAVANAQSCSELPTSSNMLNAEDIAEHAEEAEQLLFNKRENLKKQNKC